MYSDNELVREVVALAAAHGIRHAVICAGSRNAPLAHSFAACPDIETLQAVDERSAAFEALGMAEALRKPVLVCVTSGSALLDASPAIAEAFYQEIPLVLVSADRPSAWIDQRDGQTVHQPGALANFVRSSVQLPESGDLRYANRLINMALLACRGPVPGPVHINVPIAEPFFSCRTPDLPKPRTLAVHRNKIYAMYADAIGEICESRRILIVAGQMPADEESAMRLEDMQYGGCMTVAEHLANIPGSARVMSLPDIILSQADEESLKLMAPDLVITIGGHIVSKRLKQFLRAQDNFIHWHVGLDETSAPDLFFHLTRLIRTDTRQFLHSLANNLLSRPSSDSRFSKAWREGLQRALKHVEAFSKREKTELTDVDVMQAFLKLVPERSFLHLANSSPVRNALFFPAPKNCQFFCNRGVNGIDGSLSAALGNARIVRGKVFCLIGDLSFFYDSNALWRNDIPKNLRILLFNNQGGNIFRTLPGLDSPFRDTYIAGVNTFSARAQAEQAGLAYRSVSSLKELPEALAAFAGSEAPMLLEVFTDADANAAAQKLLTSPAR